MNQTIDLILSHRSIRQFTDEPIAPQQLDAILAAAQSASTSSSRTSQTNSHSHSLSTALSTQSPTTPCDILGRSVLTGICDYYYPHFVLTGFDTTVVDPGKVKMR